MMSIRKYPRIAVTFVIECCEKTQLQYVKAYFVKPHLPFLYAFYLAMLFLKATGNMAINRYLSVWHLFLSHIRWSPHSYTWGSGNTSWLHDNATWVTANKFPFNSSGPQPNAHHFSNASLAVDIFLIYNGCLWGNLPVIVGFPSFRTGYVWYSEFLCCYPEWFIE